ncbi:glycosyltransferase family 2 protein [Deltaproteobacteria bacterium]|nr:glycosyltransferase family 2 protein [Deltaproteobacteria bacterium]
MDKYRVGIVIPALNESKTIAGIVEVVGKYGVPIVVDDGSIDNTAEMALQSGVVIVRHEINRGYDAALNSGFKKAADLGTQIIITVDADGQHDPSLIQQFIEAIDFGADIVVGIRSQRQRFAEYLFAWYTGLRFGVKDPLCGIKAYRTTVYKALGHFDSYGSIGTELTIFAAKKGYRMRQIGINVRERSGESRFGQMLSGNYKIMRAMILSIWRAQ